MFLYLSLIYFMFHLFDLLIYFVCFFMYVPIKQVACGCAAFSSSDIFIKRKGRGLTLIDVLMCVPSRSSSGFFNPWDISLFASTEERANRSWKEKNADPRLLSLLCSLGLEHRYVCILLVLPLLRPDLNVTRHPSRPQLRRHTQYIIQIITPVIP